MECFLVWRGGCAGPTQQGCHVSRGDVDSDGKWVSNDMLMRGTAGLMDADILPTGIDYSWYDFMVYYARLLLKDDLPTESRWALIVVLVKDITDSLPLAQKRRGL